MKRQPKPKAPRAEAPPAPATGSSGAVSRTASLRETLLPFAAITLFAFLLRYVYLLQARAVPMFDGLIMDGESYGAWSDKIVAGDWLGDQIFYQAPLYPYFLALVKLVVGESLWSIRIVQIALGSLSCGILFLTGRQFFSRGVGLAAGIILALYPPAIFFDGCIQKANLGLLWTVLLLYALARAVKAPSIARWLGVGAALGLLMLTREETILLVPVIVAWILIARRAETIGARARWIGAWIGGLALVLLPVAARNYKVGGEFVLTTSQAGSNFYIGNNPSANGTYVGLRPGGGHNVAYERRDAIELAEREVGHALSPQEVSNFWFAKSFAFIQSEPGRWLGLMLTKVNLVLNAYELPDSEDQYFYERYVPLLSGLGFLLHYGVILPLAAAGLLLTRRRWRELSILHVVLATLFVGVVLFYVFARYRYPVVPILVLFAGAGLVEGLAVQRSKGFSALSGALLVLLVFAVMSNIRVRSKDAELWVQYSNTGIVLTTKGENQKAVEMFEKALELQPTQAEVWGNLGVSLQNLKRHDEAIAAFRKALALRPDDARAHARLGKALWLGGKAIEALDPLQRAITMAPANGEYWSVYGRALAGAGQSKAAIEALRKAAQIRPSDLGTAARLAWELATSADAHVRDGKGAVAIAEELCRRTSDADLDALDALAAAYAETGKFTEAVATAGKAIAIARKTKGSEVEREIQARLDLYRRGEAYHQAR